MTYKYGNVLVGDDTSCIDRAYAELKANTPPLPKRLSRTAFLRLATDYCQYLEIDQDRYDQYLPTRRTSTIAAIVNSTLERIFYEGAKARLDQERRVVEPHKTDNDLKDYILRRKTEHETQLYELIPLHCETHV